MHHRLVHGHHGGARHLACLPLAKQRRGNDLWGSTLALLHQDSLKTAGKGVLTGGVVGAAETRRQQGETRRAMDGGVGDRALLV
jgi:hypothetical protein